MPQLGRHDSHHLARGADLRPVLYRSSPHLRVVRVLRCPRLLPGRSATGHNICRDCAGITTNLVCVNCGREAERRRGGHCARCVLTADLTQILKPHAPPDMRIKRLITELAAVPRPESIITWMRHPVTAELLSKIGTRELSLSHEAFDALAPSGSLEHLREMLVHHHMMPNRGDPRLARFQTWLEQRLETLKPTPAIHTHRTVRPMAPPAPAP